ncbi:MAG TPA: ParB/RepB/Spo0J family partition protein [Nitrososphaeraceae archaeon]|nr:ParB/RepB/Spo0J family partition protein [Nitrososphaeraceae archaeon]
MEFVDTSIVEQIEIKMIRPSQFAIREKFQKTALEAESLACSIREHGLLQPILIRPLEHGFEVVAGHRRLQACRTLRWRFIPCKIRELSDKQAYEIQLTENIQRKSMDPLEEAEAFRKYIMEFGYGGTRDLAKKIGKSEEYVSHRLQLLELPDNIKEQICLNQLNVSQAIELVSVPAVRRSQLMEHVVNNNLTVKQIREVKSMILSKEYDDGDNDLISRNNKRDAYNHKPINIIKKTNLSLKITLARIDILIDEVHATVKPEERAYLLSFLMQIRLKIHSMIDETIRFKNVTQKLAHS